MWRAGSSLTRDWTCALLHRKCKVLTTRLPRKSWKGFISVRKEYNLPSLLSWISQQSFGCIKLWWVCLKQQHIDSGCTALIYEQWCAGKYWKLGFLGVGGSPLWWAFTFLRCKYSCYSWFQAAAAKSCQSCPTLCDPIDGSPPGSTVPGILQARILEWVATSFSSDFKLLNTILTG